MSFRKQPTTRASYGYFHEIGTRWNDNDTYGHVNNVVYFSYFDTTVNFYLIEQGLLDLVESQVVGLVVENQCTYFSSVCFPDTVHVGLRVKHLGRSSVHYEIAIFKNDEQQSAALGHFVHVYVDRQTNRSAEIPADIKAALQDLMKEPADK